MPHARLEAAVAALLLLLTAPLSLAIAIGIRLSGRGSVFYLADRAGVDGVVFRMWKFRTMRHRQGGGSRIAGPADGRVFPFGALLRKLKVDELPQLLNIVRGEMAFVGPRPEDPWFVEHAYSEADRRTLAVRPGLTSPGTLYYLTHAEQFLSATDTEESYISGPLKRKLELDCLYVENATPSLDARLVRETLCVLASRALGRKHFPAYGFDAMIAARRWPDD
jgi:lipopolysaccharide/colanic/teichoic acid biosynthesis glycosyltransferase